jgi:hypothetical protein
MKKIKLIVIIISLGLTFTASAQEDEHSNVGKHDHLSHRISLVMANAFINNSFSDETNDILIVPAFGFNYDYFINEKWGLGIHSDILLSQFKIEKHGGDAEIVRENPIALCGMLLFKPHHRWIMFVGYGVEMEKQENFQLARIGAEYGIELPKNWELGFSLEFDYKPEAYNSLLIGIGFSKLFGRVSN